MLKALHDIRFYDSKLNSKLDHIILEAYKDSSQSN